MVKLTRTRPQLSKTQEKRICRGVAEGEWCLSAYKRTDSVGPVSSTYSEKPELSGLSRDHPQEEQHLNIEKIGDYKYLKSLYLQYTLPSHTS